ncbi:UDP-N-acetyl-D-mannosamine dehydrogenase [Rubinisphaera italica]|uniref:UDP-N-acetyl-D-glucosamine 6-dehydrogenase n=1 Tax=Rubinisphaera italica TaxID=2527969 RepID=A0A5C5XB31_9PLAN|nr:UDP-N-acetyl-D-mannosamine dehydrogenase [Rubinisphaera italica]TWT59611.1 UDP-N-acetyl-D-glucosamine 6-dehydrogenase [Rubinisphaera italica]
MAQLNVIPDTCSNDSTSKSKNICVVGLGYIGLPTASVLADHGYLVHGVDVRPDVIEIINRGEIHIHEPHLGELVNKVVSQNKLKASTEPCEADVFFICVPTPINEDKTPDLSYVEAASKAIQPYVRAGNIVILESTSPPRTTQDVVVQNAIPEDLEVGKDVYVAYCPERVLPGRILIEVVENDRIVGGVTTACTDKVVEFYKSFVTGAVLPTDAISAEITKLTENAFRDVNIAFANELSILADKLGADVFEVIKLANRHPRVNILTPGPGVGGHCISVDPWFLVHACTGATPLIKTAREVNDMKPHYVVQQIIEAANRFDNPTIACLGLAYKADVDDFRESPSTEIATMLTESGVGVVLACDPYANSNNLPGLNLCTLQESIQKADILVLLTDHRQFLELSPEDRYGKTVIDPRGAWSSTKASRVGINNAA